MSVFAGLVIAVAACSPPRSTEIRDDGGSAGSGGTGAEGDLGGSGGAGAEGGAGGSAATGGSGGPVTGDGSPGSEDAPLGSVPDGSASDGNIADVPVSDRDTAIDGKSTPGPEAGVPGLANGAACSSGAACNSTFCVDGVCCESACSGQCEACGETGAKGKCVAVIDSPKGTRPACTGAGGLCGGACNGSNRTSCTYPGMEKQCAAPGCQAGTASARAVCDGKGACPPATMVSCAPLGCDGDICAGGCSAQNPCPGTSYCNAGKCFSKQQLGATCSTTDSCQSGRCVDGVCCDTPCDGACQTCNATGSAGHCGPVKSADDDQCSGTKSCDSTGACKARAGSTCSTGGDCATGNCVDGKCCTQSSCGSCQACTGGGGTCVSVTNTDDPDSCQGTCDAGGTCKSKQGQLCNKTAGGCVGGTSCSPDGVCCDQPCNELCKACDLPGFTGVCTAVASGNPRGNRASCGSGECAGSCGGRLDGQCVYPSGPCGSGPTCSGTSIVEHSACSNGACVTPAPKACAGGYTCGGSACKMSCTSAMDCVSGYFCSANSCATVVGISAGNSHTCALVSDGTVRCWGRNDRGQLGDNTGGDSAKPVKVVGIATAKVISAGQAHTCALLADGSAACWGMGGQGQLGGANRFDQLAPVAVPGFSGGSQLAAGGTFTCALVSGTVQCWGGGTDGIAMGNGLTNGSSITSGADHACALLGDRTLKCWGLESEGRLGDGTSNLDGASLVTVVGIAGASAVAAGNSHSCAIVSGSPYCWGEDNAGQLGWQPPGQATGTPGQVLGVSSANALGAGTDDTCALLTSGSVTCWGTMYDKNGQDIESSRSPTQVPGIAGASILTVGGAHNCVLLAGGLVRCWGNNERGQLGDGTTTNAATPVDVTGW